MKKIISICLSLVLLTTMCVGLDFSANAAEVDGYTAVATKEDFYNMRKKPNGKYYLADDIAFDSSDFVYHGDYFNNGSHWIAMDSFSGVLDGCGHTISGLVGDCAVALTNSGTIKNVNIDDAELTNSAICKENIGAVENCKLSNSSANGGIVFSNSGILKYCFSETSNVGICNSNSGTIEGCVNNSSFSAYNAGGIACYNYGLIKNCVNNGDVSASYRAAGIAALAGSDGTIETSINNGDIGGDVAAGIYCEDYYSNSVYGCINTGNINANSGSYGIGARIYAYNCVNIGTAKYAICGSSNRITDCYSIVGVGTDDGKTQFLTVEEMKDQSNFPKLDFKNTWKMTPNGITLQFADKKQIGVAVYQYPSKTYYNIGDKLDVSDLLVMTFDNDGEWKLTDNYTVSGFTGKFSKNVITVKSGNYSTTFNVYVRDSISKAKMTLSSTKVTATGKAIKPTVKIISSNGAVLKLNTDYTLSYSSNTNPGTASVTIKGKGLYTGSVKKTFTITPMQTRGLKVSTRKTTSLKLAWTKQNGVTGYVVQKYDSKAKKWKNYKTITKNTNSITVSKLSAGATYKFRVRSYKTIKNTKYYGAYSSTLTTPTTPLTVSMKSAKTTVSRDGRTKYELSWKKSSNVSGYQIQVYCYGYHNGKWETYWKSLTTVKGASKTSYKSGYRFDAEDAGAKFKIRAYKEVNGKKYYGSWKTVKAKVTRK